MASPDNYYGSIQDKATAFRELPKKIQAVLEGSKLLRSEVNRIRNTAGAFGAPLGRDLRASLSHLQVDLAHIEYELRLLRGDPPEILAQAERLINEPFLIIGNEPEVP